MINLFNNIDNNKIILKMNNIFVDIFYYLYTEVLKKSHKLYFNIIIIIICFWSA